LPELYYDTRVRIKIGVLSLYTVTEQAKDSIQIYFTMLSADPSQYGDAWPRYSSLKIAD